MAFNKTLLEQELKKGEELQVGWPWRIMVFSAMVFITTAGIFLGVEFGFKTYIKSQITQVDSQIDELTRSIPEDQQKSFLIFSAQANNIQKVLNDRYNTPSIFDFLEKNTIKNVFYKGVTFDAKELTVNIDGVAPDFNILAQQMEIFRNATGTISKVSLGRSSAITEKDKSGRDLSSNVSFAAVLKLKK